MVPTSLQHPPHLLLPRPSFTTLIPPPSHITCSGSRRGNRGQLHRGRTLSTEAILAVQSLKRAGPDHPNLTHLATRSLSRLLKSDLLAAIAELQRQGHYHLSLKSLLAVRSDFFDVTDLAFYADIVTALARHGMGGEIDGLVEDVMVGGEYEKRGVERLLRALVAAEKGRAAGDLYWMVRREGREVDARLMVDLVRGLRRLGEGEAADEVERDFEMRRLGV